MSKLEDAQVSGGPMSPSTRVPGSAQAHRGAGAPSSAVWDSSHILGLPRLVVAVAPFVGKPHTSSSREHLCGKDGKDSAFILTQETKCPMRMTEVTKTFVYLSQESGAGRCWIDSAAQLSRSSELGLFHFLDFPLLVTKCLP